QRDTAGLLPINPAYRVLVVEADAPTRSDVVDDQLAGSLLDAVRQYAPSTFGASPRTAPAAAQSADLIVFGTFDLAQHPEQQALARSLASTGKPVVAVGLRAPYDAAVATEIGTFLTVYGDRPVHLQAAADALFGRLTATPRAPSRVADPSPRTSDGRPKSSWMRIWARSNSCDSSRTRVGLRDPPPPRITSSGRPGRKRRYWSATECAVNAVNVARISEVVTLRCRARSMNRSANGAPNTSRPVLFGG